MTASTRSGQVRTCVGTRLEITSTASGLTCRPRFAGTWGRCQPVTVFRDGARTLLRQDGGPRRTGIAALQLLLEELGRTGSQDLHEDLALLTGQLLELAAQDDRRHHLDTLAQQVHGDDPADVAITAALMLTHPWVHDLAVRAPVLHTGELLRLHRAAPDADHLVGLIRSLYGRSGRQLVRAVAQLLSTGRLHAAAWVVLLSEISSGVSDDVLTWLLDRLADAEATPALADPGPLTGATARWLDRELQELSPQRQRRLLHGFACDRHALPAAARQIVALQAAAGTAGKTPPQGILNGCRTPTEALRRLDEVTRDVSRTTSARTGDLPTPKALLSLDGAGVGPWTVHIARSSRDLARWGAALRNCLATMGSTARGGRSVFIALTDARGTVRAAGELRRSARGWELEELLGPGNSRVDDLFWDAVRALLERAGPAG